MALDTEIKKKLMSEFGQHPGDTGSNEVQIAMLTENITRLTEHMKKSHKDFSSKRGLLRHVARRRSFLDYLAKLNPERYKKIVERLGLKG